ncbi:MAG: hypothetical protein ACM3UU_02445 [Ignavibacteriales bacterium]
MSEGHGIFSDNIVEHLSRFIGETVTIFTESGGESGSGFTGVVIFVNPCFVRLISCIGPAPSCALGSSCDSNFGFGNRCSNRCKGDSGFDRNNLGSVTDIPTNKIVAFVHNAV